MVGVDTPSHGGGWVHQAMVGVGRKLQFGLIDQLRYQRYLDTHITTCTGFFFPTEDFSVVEVTVRWVEDRMYFRSERTPVEKDQLN